ncbi:MAG: ATP-grasp domain-containing protein [Chitinophagaceae bacterium]|nr:ATP-grasp domain-containing protein [Chitinophagaceae bacterium]MDP1764756.1 ATP-grasp domain-containing protein [Sediminibacterium sp.]MDP1812212.1 ATP-grasp domain-containing protein [Sediminibacterium sp.]MDP3128948.1 ATP-grasp domain-containing protein [Sediminibacterium sp.]
MSNNHLKVCVLLPDYSTSAVDYQYYDPPRNLSALLPEATVDHVFLNKLTTYQQLKALQHKGYTIFVNLCEGYLEWEVPSIDVIYTLELLGLPYTGPTTLLYDPPKELMKYVAYCEGIATPAYTLLEKEEDLHTATAQLTFPLFIKPAKAGDSLGIDEHSLVHNQVELLEKVKASLQEYPQLLAEEYIAGREFTVLIAANADGKTATSFKPVEFIFPSGFAFKTYALKTSELHPDANIPCNDPLIEQQLRDAAQKIFKGFNGVGYARLDFRLNEKGQLYFLEINFTCSVFYRDGYEGSADYILNYDGIGQAGYLRHIIAEGMARYARIQKKYTIKGDAIAGYGIYATRFIQAKELIFNGEGRSQRIITRRYVAENWTGAEKEIFARYAYPVSNEVFLLWDENPAEWAPQNHSCRPNTAYDGLNVLALCSIQPGQELTLDYASFLDDMMEPFQCRCGAPNCRGLVSGKKNNSVTSRETRAGN